MAVTEGLAGFDFTSEVLGHTQIITVDTPEELDVVYDLASVNDTAALMCLDMVAKAEIDSFNARTDMATAMARFLVKKASS